MVLVPECRQRPDSESLTPFNQGVKGPGNRGQEIVRYTHKKLWCPAIPILTRASKLFREGLGDGREILMWSDWDPVDHFLRCLETLTTKADAV